MTVRQQIGSASRIEALALSEAADELDSSAARARLMDIEDGRDRPVKGDALAKALAALEAI